MTISELHASHIGRVAVAYSISGVDFNPDALTARIRIEPTRTFRRGQPRLGVTKQPIGTHPEGYWELSSKALVTSKDVNDHFNALLNLLNPHVAMLRELAEQGEAFFDVWWESSYLYAGTGPLLSAGSIAGAAALGAAMGFDIYQIDNIADTASS